MQSGTTESIQPSAIRTRTPSAIEPRAGNYRRLLSSSNQSWGPRAVLFWGELPKRPCEYTLWLAHFVGFPSCFWETYSQN